jgi:transcriptional regulator with XRE-family HTH domain
MVLHFRAIRQACGLTLQAVSADIERSVGGLSGIERGKQTISLEVVEVLARRYQCHPWDLVTFPDFPEPACQCHRAEETA